MRRFALIAVVLALALGSAVAPLRATDVGQMRFGYIPAPFGASPSMQNLQFDATTDAIEFIFQCDKAMSITTGYISYSTRTNTPPTFRLSLQGVTTGTGRANGTPKTGATVTFTPPASAAWDNSIQALTFGTPYSCTRGELLAMVIDYSSGTINGTAGSFFNYAMAGTISGLPYAVSVNGGVGTKATTFPTFGYGDGTTVYGGLPVSAVAITQYSVDTASIDERAATITMPSAICSTFTLAGVRAQVRGSATGKTVKVQVYNGTSVVDTMTWNSDVIASVAANDYVTTFRPTSATALTCGTTYYIGFQPQETASNFALREFQMNGAAALTTAWPGGAIIGSATRVDAGSWASISTPTRYAVEFIIEDITAPVSSGGRGVIQ